MQICLCFMCPGLTHLDPDTAVTYLTVSLHLIHSVQRRPPILIRPAVTRQCSLHCRFILSFCCQGLVHIEVRLL